MTEPNPKMSDEERKQLIKKMNQETDEFIKEMTEKNKDFKYSDGFTSENIDEVLETHPAFMTENPTQEQIDKSPLLQGLQALMYDDPDDTPEQQAIAYKKDGNFQFKCKKYKNACLAYTEGLKKVFDDKDLRAVLFTNRSAANYYLQNYRSSLHDANQALKLKPEHVKALVKCCQCCHALKKYENVITWCSIALDIDPKNSILNDLLKESKHLLQVEKRNERKAKIALQKQKEKEKMLVDAIQSRGINISITVQKNFDCDEESDTNQLMLANLENQSISDSVVYLDDDNNLIWPVLFVYPEYKTTDFIEKFNENCMFEEILAVMFEDQADWDQDHKYKIDSLRLYFESGKTSNTLYHFDKSKQLSEVLNHKDFQVQAGTPNFFILSRASQYHEHFLKNYDEVKEV